MRARPRKSLTLNRETLRALDAAALAPVPGRGLITITISTIFPPTFTQGICDSVASCSALAEDCCIGIAK